jgi:exonuclease VII small subunit
MVALTESMERMEGRLEAAAALFERAAALIEQQESERTGEVRKIVAAVETSREAELQRKLETAEQTIADLRVQIEARAEAPQSGRKTVPASTAQFLAKQGIASLDALEAGTLDAALNGLSLEQRIAVKAQLLRAGVVS